MVETFFNRLARVNAVLIFLVLVALIGFLVWNAWFLRDFHDAPRRSPTTSERSHSIFADEYAIVGGKVLAYRATAADGMPIDEADGTVSLVNVRTGAKRLLPEEGDPRRLRLWDVVYRQHDGQRDKQDIAVGYLARVATDAQWKDRRADLIVGRFSDFKQVQVFSNLEAIDAPQLRGDGNLAMIVWLGERTAELVVFDFAATRVEKRDSLALPKGSRNSMSVGDYRTSEPEVGAVPKGGF